MTFQKKMQKSQVKVWSDFYFQYELMKKLLEPIKTLHKEKEKSVYKKEKEGQKANMELNQVLTQAIRIDDSKVDLVKVQQQFSEQFVLELKKVDHFYCECLNQRIKPRLNAIKGQLDHAQSIKEFNIYQDTFELAIKELYKEVILIKGFVDINLEAKEKMMFKFQKYSQYFERDFPTNVIENVKTNFEKLDISKSKTELDILIDELTKLFNVYFIDKYKSGTNKRLKSYTEGNKFTQSQSFYLGFFIGLLLFQLFVIIFIAYHYNLDIDKDPDFKSVFPMFKAFFVVCLYWWVLGFNVFAWNKAEISYKVIFQFSNHYSDVISIYKRAAIFTFILLSCMIIYCLNRINVTIFFGYEIPTHILPLICWGSFLGYMFCPFKSMFNYEGRIYLFNLFTESIGSFLIKPDFRHVWLIDQMTSLIGPMRDMEYTLCYYAYYEAPLLEKKSHCNNTRGIYLFIAFFPNFLRILQCTKMIIDSKNPYPQKYNILKYCLNLCVATFSFLLATYPMFHPIWFVTSLVSTCYSFFWDLKFDFGFLQPGKGFPLREKLCYSSKKLYYFAVIANFFLRFLWLITLSPEVIAEFVRPETLSVSLFALEIFRRGMWNCIRVETKHLEISKEFRVTNDVELPFVKQNGKYINNESNILSIMGMTREEKMRVEMEKIKEEKAKKINYESRFIHDFDNSQKESVNDELNEYLKGYRISTENNINFGESGYKREFSRKI